MDFGPENGVHELEWNRLEWHGMAAQPRACSGQQWRKKLPVFIARQTVCVGCRTTEIRMTQ